MKSSTMKTRDTASNRSDIGRTSIMKRLRFLVTGVLLLASLPSVVQALPNIVIDSPTHGKWEAPTGVEGHIDGFVPIGSYVLVNDVVANLNPITKDFSLPWMAIEAGFPPNHVFHPVLAELRNANDTVLDRDRVVVYNPSEFGARRVWPGKVIDNAVFARLNDTFFPDISLIIARALSAAVGPDHESGAPNLMEWQAETGVSNIDVVEFPPVCFGVGEAASDMLNLLPVTLPLPLGATDFCVTAAQGVMNTLALTGDLSVTATPANDQVDVTVDISEVFADIQISLIGYFKIESLQLGAFWFNACNPVGGIGPVSVSGSVGLDPNADSPKKLDITSVAPLEVDIDDVLVGYEGMCGVPLLEEVLEWLDGLLMKKVERAAENSMTRALPGPLLMPHATPASVKMLLTNAVVFPFFEFPISGDFETPLGGISFNAPMNYVSEGPVGLEASFNFNVTNQDTHPNAPTINHAFFVEDMPPFLQYLTPDTQTYELAASVHTGVLNKALNTATQLGVFHFELGELDLDALDICLSILGVDVCTGVIQLNSTILSQKIPAFAALPAGTALEIVVEPTLPPVVSMVDPVAPEKSTLYAHATHHLVSVIERSAAGDITWMQVALDLRAGLGVDAGPIPGHLDFDLEKDDGGYLLSAIILEHNFGAWPDETFLTDELGFVVDSYVEDELINTLEDNPVPTINVPQVESLPAMQPTSIDILPVETAIANNYITVYMDMDIQ